MEGVPWSDPLEGVPGLSPGVSPMEGGPWMVPMLGVAWTGSPVGVPL
jgi:hypothetical protein